MAGALKERYRLARSVKEGYEIRMADGRWLKVEHKMHVVAPLNFIRLRLADDEATVLAPDDQVMSRRPADEAG